MYDRGVFGEKIHEPVLYKRRVVDSLENLNYLASNKSKTDNNSLASFDAIQNELQNASERIAIAYAEEAEASREQAAEIAEEIGFALDQISYDISSGLGDVEYAVKASANKVAKHIDTMSLALGYQLKVANCNLENINRTIQVSNQLLSFIAGKLEQIRHLMTIPNEVEALELAEQARINFALGKNKKALEITSKAMELCSTSIPVTAYHIIALCSQNNGYFFEETKVVLNDYAKLIAFKLKDKGSDEKLAILDTSTMTYPVLQAISTRYGAAVLESAKKIYKSISVNKKAACDFVQCCLIDDECAHMINAPTILRELHWSTSLDVMTNETVNLSDFSSYFSALSFDVGISRFLTRTAESKSPIAREIQLVTIGRLHKKNIIREYLDSYISLTLAGQKVSNDQISVAQVNTITFVIGLEPQEKYQHDQYTKTLLAEYAKYNRITFPSKFDAIIDKHEKAIKEDIDTIYLPNFENAIKEASGGEKDDLLKLNSMIESTINDIQAYNKNSERELSTREEEIKQNEKKINALSGYRNSSYLKEADFSKSADFAFLSACAWVVGVFFFGPDVDFELDNPGSLGYISTFFLKVWYMISGGILTFVLISILHYLTYNVFRTHARSALFKMNASEKTKNKKSDEYNSLQMDQKKYIETKLEEVRYFRRNRLTEIKKAQQKLDDLLKEKILKKYYIYPAIKNRTSSQGISSLPLEYFIKNSIMGTIVNDVQSGRILKLSPDYNKTINQFLKKIDGITLAVNKPDDNVKVLGDSSMSQSGRLTRVITSENKEIYLDGKERKDHHEVQAIYENGLCPECAAERDEDSDICPECNENLIYIPDGFSKTRKRD